MKNGKKKKLLIIALVIFLLLAQIGVTNFISYAQNASAKKAAALISEANTPTVKISIAQSQYVCMVGDTISVKANVVATGLNEEGEHPDKVELMWQKVTGGRPFPFEPMNQTTDTLTIENAQLSNSARYHLEAHVLQWNPTGGEDNSGAYELMKEGDYVKSFYSPTISIDVLPKLHVDLKKDTDNRLKGSKEEGYTLQLDAQEEYKLNLDLYRLKNEENQNSRIPYEKVKSIKWETSNKDVVEVTNSGKLISKAYNDEKVTITVTVTDLDEAQTVIKVTVIVKRIEVESVTINEKDVKIQVGEHTTLTATITPPNATLKKPTWKIADGFPEDIIELDPETGVITGNKLGETKVVAVADDQISEELSVKVVETPVTEIIDGLSDTNISLWEIGDDPEGQHSLTIHPEVLPANATNKKITWQSTDSSVATVVENRNGSVSFIAGLYDETNNECDIIATAENNPETTDDDVTRVYHITILDNYKFVKNLTITTIENGEEVDLTQNSEIELKVGEKKDFNFKVSPTDATFKDEEWFASKKWNDAHNQAPTDIISVDAAGVVTANAEGTAYLRIAVTCQSPDCPKHSNYVTIKVVKVPVESVQIEQDTVHLTKIEKKTLTAIVLPENATNKTVKWTSDNEEVATVNEVTGEVTAIKPGRAIITATAEGGKTDTCEIIVDPIEVESLQISDITLTVKDNIIIGDKKLTVTPYPSNADNVEIIWKSDDDSIVEVRDGGIIVPKRAGTAIITAYLKGNENICVLCQVTVVPSKAQVVVYTVDQNINFISEITLRLTGKDENGTQIEPKELTTKGQFDFGELPDGEYTVETLLPKAKNILNASEIDIIDYVKLFSFRIDCGEILYTNLSNSKLEHADSIVLVNIVDYPDETGEEELVANIGSGENYDKDGKTILEQYIEYDKFVPVQSIVDELSSTNISLVENDKGSTEDEHSLTIHPKVSPSNATNKEITWTSSDEKIAKVIQNADGSVSFVAGKYNAEANTCEITATSHNGKTRVYHITVVEKVISVDSVAITPEKPIKLKVGETFDFNFTVNPSNATYKQDKWTVEPKEGSPANVISVDESGVVTANALGKAYVKIIVTCQNPECPTHDAKSALIEVVATPVESVEIEAPEVNGEKTVTVPKNTTIALSAKVLPDNATYKNVTWTSDNEDVATVDSEGNVTTHAPGKAIIKCTANDGKYDICNIIVPEIRITSLEISKTELTMKDNEETKLTVITDPEDADNKDEIKWESSDTEVAEVRADGTVVAKKAGETTITVYIEDDDTVTPVTCKVTVEASAIEPKPDEGGSTPPTEPDKPETDEPSIDETQPSEPEDNSSNNVTPDTPDTSDMPIVRYIVMMIGSFIAITFIICKRNKNLRKKSIR